MEILLVAQIIYYFTVSFAILVIGVFSIIIVYHLMHITKHLGHIADNIDDASTGLKEEIEDILAALSTLPILSYFLKRHGMHKSHVCDKKIS